MSHLNSPSYSDKLLAALKNIQHDGVSSPVADTAKNYVRHFRDWLLIENKPTVTRFLVWFKNEFWVPGKQKEV